MNLQAKTLYFFALSSFLVFFSACKSKRNLGQEFVPDNEKVGVYSDTIPLVISTLKLDSSQTRYLGSFLVGDLDHPDAASNSVITFSKLNYLTTQIDPSAKYDSMTIRINGISYIYGDTLQDFNLIVYKTKEALDTAKKYVSQSFSYENNEDSIVARATFSPSNYRSSSSSIYMSVAPFYGQQILDAVKNTSSDTAFSRMMKGLAFTGSNNTKNGLLLINRSAISITMYYSVNGVGPYSLALSPTNGDYISYNLSSFNTVLKNKLSGLKNRDTLKSTDNNGLVYLQHFSSLNAKVSIPSLATTIGTHNDNILINKAEIVLKASKNLNQFPDHYYNPEAFYIRYSNKNNMDVSFNSSYYMYSTVLGSYMISSYYDTSDESYKINVTEYIQNILDGRIDVKDLIIESNALGIVTLGDGSQNPKNFILKVHYSKLK
jgi:hypothetical protein